MKNYILIFTIALTLNSSAQNIDNETKVVNDIINYFVKQDSTLLDKRVQMVDGFNSGIQAPAEWYIHPDIFSKIEPYFNISDSIYYFDQINNRKNVKLILTQDEKTYSYVDKKKIDDFINKSEEDYNKGIKSDFYAEFDKQIGIIQEFALPIISKDGRYLLFRRIKSGPGRKASSFLKLYEKKENDWVYIKTILEQER